MSDIINIDSYVLINSHYKRIIKMDTDYSVDARLNVFKTLYNSRVMSDIILMFNGEKYYLISELVKVMAPLLHAKYEQATIQDLPFIGENLSSTQIVETIGILLNSDRNKKIVTIIDNDIPNIVVEDMLKHIYGSPLSLSNDHIYEIYLLAEMFGVARIMETCMRTIQNNIRNGTLHLDFNKVLKSKKPTMSIFRDLFYANIEKISTDDVFVITGEMDVETIKDLVTNVGLKCREDLVFEIIADWCPKYMSKCVGEMEQSMANDICRELMSNVSLNKLSVKLLLDKVDGHPFINREDYHNTLKNHLLTSSLDSSFSSLRNANDTFAIGKFNGSYSGYKQLKSDDMNDEFKQLFKETYMSNDNAILCLDTFLSDIIWLDNDRALQYMGRWLRIGDKHVCSGEYVKIMYSTCDKNIKNDLKNTDIHNITACLVHSRRNRDNTMLFVKTSVTF